MSDLDPHMDAARERLLEESLDRQRRTLDRRERLGNRLFAGGFLAVRGDARPARRRRARVLAAARAAVRASRSRVVARVELWGDTGTFRADADRLRADAAAAADAAGAAARRGRPCVLAKASRALRGRRSPLGRSALAVADAWFSLGPALVLDRPRRPAARLRALAGVPRAALAAQIASDATRLRSPRMRVLPAGSRRATRCRDLRVVVPRRHLLFPIGLLAAIAAADAPAAALLRAAARLPAALVLARARGEHAQVARARPRLPRHGAAAARPARGGRRVHGPPHGGRGRADRLGRRAHGPRRGHAPLRRARRPAARHRQDRRARRDHQQAGPARTTRSGRS